MGLEFSNGETNFLANPYSGSKLTWNDRISWRVFSRDPQLHRKTCGSWWSAKFPTCPSWSERLEWGLFPSWPNCTCSLFTSWSPLIFEQMPEFMNSPSLQKWGIEFYISKSRFLYNSGYLWTQWILFTDLMETFSFFPGAKMTRGALLRLK